MKFSLIFAGLFAKYKGWHFFCSQCIITTNIIIIIIVVIILTQTM